MMLGDNLPGDGRVLGVEAAVAGARLIRLPLRLSFDLRAWMRDTRNSDCQIMLVGDSHPDSTTDDESQWADRIAQAEARYGDLVDYWCWGNEWDAERDAASSWVMAPDRLNRLTDVARAVQGHRSLWLAACCSGQPSRLADINLSGLSGICINPYAKDPNTPELEAMLQGYFAYGLPVGVSEFDSRTAGMAAWLGADGRLAFACAFCHDDQMVVDFGLVDINGRRKPSYFEFQQAALAGGVPDTGGIDMAQYVMGFKDIADRLGGAAGEPLEDEHDCEAFGHQARHQATQTGHMIYLKDVPGAQPVFLAGR